MNIGYVAIRIVFNDDGSICSMTDEGGFLPCIKVAQTILAHCKNYVKKMKSDDFIDYQNYIIQRQWADEMVAINQGSAANEKEHKISNVYLIFDPANNSYKIGKANNPVYRAKQLSSGNPSIKLICSYQATHKNERDLHDMFDEVRLAGEWFRLDNRHIAQFHQYFGAIGSVFTNHQTSDAQ